MNKLKKYLKTIGVSCMAVAMCFMLAGCNLSQVNVTQETFDSLIETATTTDEKLQELIEAVENNKIDLDELYAILNEQNNKISTTDAYNMALIAEIKLENNIGEEACAYKVEHTNPSPYGNRTINEYFAKLENNSKIYMSEDLTESDPGKEVIYFNEEQAKYVYYDTWSEEANFYRSYLEAINYSGMANGRAMVRAFNKDDVINVETLENGNIKVTMFKQEIIEEETVSVEREHTYIVELNTNGLIVSINWYTNQIDYSSEHTHYFELVVSSNYTYGLSEDDLEVINNAIEEVEAVIAENN